MISFNIEGRGTFQRAFRLARSLSDIGHDLTVLASDPSSRKINERIIDNVSVVTFPSLLHGSLQSGWDLYETVKRIRWLKVNKFDVVHAFELVIGLGIWVIFSQYKYWIRNIPYPL